MQGSFDKRTEMSSLSITLKSDAVNQRQTWMIVAYNGHGDVIASTGANASGWGQAELLQDLLHDVALGWLYGDAKAATVAPMAAYRTALKLANATARR